MDTWGLAVVALPLSRGVTDWHSTAEASGAAVTKLKTLLLPSTNWGLVP